MTDAMTCTPLQASMPEPLMSSNTAVTSEDTTAIHSPLACIEATASYDKPYTAYTPPLPRTHNPKADWKAKLKIKVTESLSPQAHPKPQFAQGATPGNLFNGGAILFGALGVLGLGMLLGRAIDHVALGPTAGAIVKDEKTLRELAIRSLWLEYIEKSDLTEKSRDQAKENFDLLVNQGYYDEAIKQRIQAMKIQWTPPPKACFDSTTFNNEECVKQNQAPDTTKLRRVIKLELKNLRIK